MQLDFSKLGNGLIPAIVQDASTNVVLMLGFMNEEAFEKTKKEGKVTFYSRTKKRLWTKGEESGNFLNVVSITPDCDNDTILIKAIPEGPVCHTGNDTCFAENNKGNINFLIHLQNVIDERLQNMPEGSYTTTLFEKGINRIAQKVGEEAVETVIEAKDNNDELFLNEVADLTYHMLVLLTAKSYRIEDVIKVLQERHK
jgi:phosphoribosyl-ATP pyrophosphohydrolase/phosphoribosyl-AMP cyclohydrolase